MRGTSIFACVILILLSSQLASGQAKFNLKTGLYAARFEDEKESNADLWHIEHRYGFDIHVMNYRLAYIPGFHYQRMSINREEQPFSNNAFNKRNNYHIIRIPMSMGYQVIDRGMATMTVFGGGYVKFILEADDNPAQINTEHLHDLTVGFQAGVQVTLSVLSVDFQYGHALSKFFLERPDSKLRSFGVSVGIKI